jgi:hypothetical protein
VDHSFVVITSWAAIAAGTLATVAQYRRVNAQGIEGVSTATWLLFTLIGGFWVSYGAFSAHSMVVILGSLLCWPLQVAIVFRLAPWRHWRGTIQSTGLFTATCVVPGVVGGWSYCVYGCGLAMTMLRGPQFVELVRTRDASGVSAASWFFGASCAALWIIYYANVSLWAPLIATAASGTASLVLALMAVWRHRRAEEDFIRREVFAT